MTVLFTDLVDSTAMRSRIGDDLADDVRREHDELISRLVDLFLGDVAAPKTREALERRLDDPEVSSARLDDKRRAYNVARLAILVLGSPDFQRR